MMTLIEHFKTKVSLPIGSFLSCQIDGNMYVISLTEMVGLNAFSLVNIMTGEVLAKGHLLGSNFVRESELRRSLSSLFEVPNNKTKEDFFILWFKLSKQEAIGKFASLVLEK